MSTLQWIALVLASPFLALALVTIGIWLNTLLARFFDRHETMDPFQERAFLCAHSTRPERAWGICVEGFWQAIAIALQWSHAIRRFSNPELRPGEGPLIVLVAGYLENGGLMWPLAQRLRTRGFQATVIDLPSTLFALEKNVPFVDEQVRRLMGEADVETCVLVGHSMGGVIGRAYVHHHDDHPVAAVVTLCSPHRGTHIARLGLGAAARDMQPGSEHMLRYPPTRVTETPVHTLVSTQDNIVSPPWSTLLLEGDNVVLDEPVGHVAPLFMASVAERVAQWADAALKTRLTQAQHLGEGTAPPRAEGPRPAQA